MTSIEIGESPDLPGEIVIAFGAAKFSVTPGVALEVAQALLREIGRHGLPVIAVDTAYVTRGETGVRLELHGPAIGAVTVKVARLQDAAAH